MKINVGTSKGIHRPKVTLGTSKSGPSAQWDTVTCQHDTSTLNYTQDPDLSFLVTMVELT